MFRVLIALLVPLCLVCNISLAEIFCPYKGYKLFEDEMTCFKVHESPKREFEDARAFCQKEARDQGDLAFVKSLNANGMIKASLTKGRRYWIGVTKTENNSLMYGNGTHVSFKAPWAYGEPNDHGNGERCVEMIANIRGAWNDKRCTRKRPFVCQTDALERKIRTSLQSDSAEGK